jgi:hypothetical protein
MRGYPTIHVHERLSNNTWTLEAIQQYMDMRGYPTIHGHERLSNNTLI